MAGKLAEKTLDYNRKTNKSFLLRWLQACVVKIFRKVAAKFSRKLRLLGGGGGGSNCFWRG